MTSCRGSAVLADLALLIEISPSSPFCQTPDLHFRATLPFDFSQLGLRARRGLRICESPFPVGCVPEAEGLPPPAISDERVPLTPAFLD